MKSITIHGLDVALDKCIKRKAKKYGLSLNKTIKKLLEESLGIKKKKSNNNKKEFMDCFGVWTAEDEKAFNFATADLEKVYHGDWV